MLESLLTAVFLSKRIKASIFTVVQLLSIRYASGVSLMTEYRITSAVQARGRTVIMPLSLSVISSTLLPPIGSSDEAQGERCVLNIIHAVKIQKDASLEAVILE